jgi:hypothetical protein
MPDRSSAQSREPDGTVPADKAETVSQAISRVERAAWAAQSAAQAAQSAAEAASAAVRQARDDTARKRPRRRRILALGVVGGVLLLATWWVYPRTPGLDNVGPAQLTITTAATVTGVDYTVGFPDANDVAVTVFAEPHPSASEVTVHLTPPAGHVKAEFTGWSKTVRLSTVGDRALADANFSVIRSHTGVAYNDLNASAAIPNVTVSTPNANPELIADYNIPSGDSYDWSSFPPLTSMPDDVEWQIPLTMAYTAGRLVVGTNHARETSDNFWTFIAGALVALGGAALLAAFQEALSPAD